MDEDEHEARGFRELSGDNWPNREQVRFFINHCQPIAGAAELKGYTQTRHDAISRIFHAKNEKSVCLREADVIINDPELNNDPATRATTPLVRLQDAWYSYQKALAVAGKLAGWNEQEDAKLWHLLKLDVSRAWDGKAGWWH